MMHEQNHDIGERQTKPHHNETGGNGPNRPNAKRKVSYVFWGNGHWGWGKRKRGCTGRGPEQEKQGGSRGGKGARTSSKKLRGFGLKRTNQKERKRPTMTEKTLTILTLNTDGLREEGRVLALAAYAAQIRADALVITETHL